MSRAESEASEFQALFDLIGELARRRYQAAEHSFTSLGLNHSEAHVLALLHQSHGTAGQEELSAMVFVDRTNTGRALQRLERGGYIVRRKDDSDRRTNVVRITEKGRKTVAGISKLRKKMAQSFFGNLNADEAATIVALLRKAM